MRKCFSFEVAFLESEHFKAGQSLFDAGAKPAGWSEGKI
jgi:hypothetical protein